MMQTLFNHIRGGVAHPNLYQYLSQILYDLEKIMAAQDDFKVAMSAMQTSVADATTQLSALAAALTSAANTAGGLSPADTAAAASTLNQMASNLTAAVKVAQIPAPVPPAA